MDAVLFSLILFTTVVQNYELLITNLAALPCQRLLELWY